MKMNKRMFASMIAATLAVGAAGVWAEPADTAGAGQNAGAQPAAAPVSSAVPAAVQGEEAAGQAPVAGQRQGFGKPDGAGKRMGAGQRGGCHGMGGMPHKGGKMQPDFMGGMPHQCGMMQPGFMGGMPYNGGMMSPIFLGIISANGDMMAPGFMGGMPYNGGMMAPGFMGGMPRHGGMMMQPGFMGGMPHQCGMMQPGSMGKMPPNGGMMHHPFKGDGDWQQKDLKLDVSKVKTLMDAFLIRHGQSGLQVGEITSGDNNTFNVNILGADNSIVKTLKVSGATGHPVGRDGGFGRPFGGKGGDADLKLDISKVKSLMDAKLIYEGNPRLMVGNIRPGEQEGTFLVDILTVDNSLVETRTISAATGRQVRGD